MIHLLVSHNKYFSRQCTFLSKQPKLEPDLLQNLLQHRLDSCNVQEGALPSILLGKGVAPFSRRHPIPFYSLREQRC